MRAVVVAVSLLWWLTTASANVEDDPACGSSTAEGFSNIQIETSDITLHERLFEQVLHAPSIQRLDHPQTDLIRIYCLRDVVVTIRQDLRHPRQTGWVQINFWVKDVASVQETLQSAVRHSALAQLAEADRDKIIRFRMKPGVMRGHRKVDRLEVYGPEGFLIGFDQPTP
ncbi:MAG TPA: hypothetical protein VFR79_04450 [Nitrospira sp.]|nr:hypothetical protein [Nitrospira sp.]